MKSRLVVILFVVFCLISRYTHAFSVSYEKIQNASRQKEQWIHFSNHNFPNTEIELGNPCFITQYTGYKFKKLLSDLFSYLTACYYLFYNSAYNLGFPTCFLPASRLLIFPFHSFW